MATEWNSILMRVREALKVTAPVPGHSPAPAGSDPSTNHGARQWLPHVGDTFQERLALFEKNAADLRASFCLVHRHEEFAKGLVDLKQAEGWKKVASHTGELTDQACHILGLP